MCSSSCLNVMTSNPSKIISISVLWQQQTPLLLDLQLKRHVLHRLSKTSLACYNFDTCELTDFDIFGRNVTDKVSNQNRPTLYYMPRQITCASALPGKTGKHEYCIFHSNAVLMHCLNSTSCLVSSIFFIHILTYSPCCITPKSCDQWVHLGVLGTWFRIKQVESAAEVGLWCKHSALMRCLLGFLFRKVMQKHYRWESKASSSDFLLYQ